MEPEMFNGFIQFSQLTLRIIYKITIRFLPLQINFWVQEKKKLKKWYFKKKKKVDQTFTKKTFFATSRFRSNPPQQVSGRFSSGVEDLPPRNEIIIVNSFSLFNDKIRRCSFGEEKMGWCKVGMICSPTCQFSVCLGKNKNKHFPSPQFLILSKQNLSAFCSRECDENAANEAKSNRKGWKSY